MNTIVRMDKPKNADLWTENLIDITFTYIADSMGYSKDFASHSDDQLFYVVIPERVNKSALQRRLNAEADSLMETGDNYSMKFARILKTATIEHSS